MWGLGLKVLIYSSSTNDERNPINVSVLWKHLSQSFKRERRFPQCVGHEEDKEADTADNLN